MVCRVQHRAFGVGMFKPAAIVQCELLQGNTWASYMGWAGATLNAACATPFSEPEMRERLVRFRHAVHFLALLHRAATAFRRIHELGRETLAHRLLAALARRFAQPPH